MASISSIADAVVKAPRRSLEGYGDQLLFYARALFWVPRAIRRYPREITATLAEVTFGSGALALIAGSVGVIAFLAFFAGTEVGIQGYASLSQIGVAKFSAFISAYFNSTTTMQRTGTVTGLSHFYKSGGNDAATVNATGYSAQTHAVMVTKVEIFQP